MTCLNQNLTRKNFTAQIIFTSKFNKIQNPKKWGKGWSH